MRPVKRQTESRSSFIGAIRSFAAKPPIAIIVVIIVIILNHYFKHPDPKADTYGVLVTSSVLVSTRDKAERVPL